MSRRSARFIFRALAVGGTTGLAACAMRLSPTPESSPSDGETCQREFIRPSREHFASNSPCGAPEPNQQTTLGPVSLPSSGSSGGIPAGVYDAVSWSEIGTIVGGPERLIIFQDRTFIRSNVFAPGPSKSKFPSPGYLELSSGTVVVTDNTLTFKKDCTVVRGGGQPGEWPGELEETWACRVGFDCSTEFVLWRDEIGASTPNGVTYVRR